MEINCRCLVGERERELLEESLIALSLERVFAKQIARGATPIHSSSLAGTVTHLLEQ